MEFVSGVTNNSIQGNISCMNLLFNLCISVLLGLILSVVYSINKESSKNLKLSIIFIPATVSLVIMVVNNDIGAGIATAGVFSMIRFRSIPGTSRDIGIVFVGMAVGVTIGMGHYPLAILATCFISGGTLLVSFIFDLKEKKNEQFYYLSITVPEDLSFYDSFDDVFEKYTDYYVLESVKSFNMGSMFKLKYEIKFPKQGKEKEMLDEIRCRNGNLEVQLYMRKENVQEF